MTQVTRATAPAAASAGAPATAPATKRARQREATFTEIVAVSRALLSDGEEVSLRAVAGRMGITAPALYRYVASYQELVDLVAYEIDKAATDLFHTAAARQPADDPAAQILAAAVAFRRWALASPREFTLVFANPIADSSCARRDFITSATSGHFFNALLVELWEKYRFPYPSLDELPDDVAAALADPILPIDLDLLPEDGRGLLWVFISSWAALYGTVTLEVFGHMDPRIIESGAMFAAMIHDQMDRLGMEEERERLEALLAAELARPA